MEFYPFHAFQINLHSLNYIPFYYNFYSIIFYIYLYYIHFQSINSYIYICYKLIAYAQILVNFNPE